MSLGETDRYSSQGAVYDEYLTDNVSVLLCNDSSLSRDKIRHALDWDLPAVKADWLWDCLKLGQLKAFGHYLINPDNQVHKVRETSKETTMTTETGPRTDIRSDFGEHHGHTKLSPKHSRNNMGEAEPLTRRGALKARDSSCGSADDAINMHSSQGSYVKLPLDHVKALAAPHGTTTTPVPLRELSPNSPPKPPPPLAKSQESASSLSAQADKDSLSTAISSLLAHHKRNPKKAPPPVPAEPSGLSRRKRKLFGRAPSNLSTCSNGSVSISRASSVDTMNTDGLGTPLEVVHSATMKADVKDPLTASLLASYDEHDNANDTDGENLPMTQLGYEDPEAGAWRERLMNKMNGGGKDTKAKNSTPKVKGIGTVQDAVGVGPQNVSRRTRHAGGR